MVPGLCWGGGWGPVSVTGRRLLLRCPKRGRCSRGWDPAVAMGGHPAPPVPRSVYVTGGRGGDDLKHGVLRHIYVSSATKAAYVGPLIL